MRISTSTIYDTGIRRIQQQQADMLHIQQQVSTGRRLLTPSEDPVAAASVLELTQSMNVNEQNGTNANAARNKLELEESHLTDLTTLIQDVKTLAVQAGNDVLTDGDRAMVVSELQSRYQALLGLSNVSDESGEHLFSGFMGATQPFSETSPGTVVYNGDQGQRMLRISAGHTVAVSDSGADVFQRIKNGNGVFATGAAGTNTGTGIVSQGSVQDITKWNSATNNKDFTIKFDVSAALPPVTTYDIVDNVSGDSLLTGAPATGVGPYLRTFNSGSAISLKTDPTTDTNATPFDFGSEISVEGAPSTDDVFTVKASTNVDLFTTLNNLITGLQPSVPGNLKSAVLHNSLNAAMSNLDNALDNVLTVRAAVGARMKEVDSVQNTREDLTIQYKSSISDLQDVDYAKVISDLTLQQTQLQASQKSFVSTQSLSLFNYISG